MTERWGGVGGPVGASHSGRVSFVGAGPGDPELITVKGLRRLQHAGVVTHDRLIPSELLCEVRPDAEVIDVGKAPGRHCVAQATINALIVDRAQAGHRVVRLKGGDPGVFGRLGEELDAVRAAGVDFEIVPGVTAATAAAATAGISLTGRGRASTVVLATATDHTGAATPTLAWDALAGVDGTLVFYMVARRLASISSTLLTRGRDPREPAVVVEAAGTSAARVICGHLATIGDLARRATVQPPAILVTGPTVGPSAMLVARVEDDAPARDDPAPVPSGARCATAGAGR